MLKKICYSIIFIVCILCISIGVNADEIKPSAESLHPYVYLNSEYIESLFDESGNIKPEFEKSYNQFVKIANESLGSQPTDGILDSSISNKLAIRAMMHVLDSDTYGLSHAKETVAYTLNYIKNAKTAYTDNISMYKDYGSNAIQIGALVYDWCYDVMTEEQKNLLPQYTMALYDIKDANGLYIQPCRASNVDDWSEIAGTAVGQPIVYNSIAATAFYDFNASEFYNVIMPKIQGNMAEAVKMYGIKGALTDGSISYTREYYTYYIQTLFKRLGATDDELESLYGNQQPIGYKMLYARTPYGALIKQGDDFYQHNYVMNTYTKGAETTIFGQLAALYGNQYFKHQYLKQNSTINDYLEFICTSGTEQSKLPDDLPLAYKTSDPRSEILARTSWQDGITSKTVTAYMNMNERRTGDHDHADIGNFQLYYKGPLTMPAGIYSGGDWGGNHWAGFYVRTSAANCVTVTNPSDKFIFAGNTPIFENDGGQRFVVADAGTPKENWTTYTKLSEHQSEISRRAQTESTFIGPQEKTPAFSYIKGDITKAYSDITLDSYKRSMVFMDTFNDTYPGALVVFDRVVSDNASYKKKWLLQSVSDPQISGNTITITNTKDGANGKLVNTTLLPENPTISKVGGIDKYVINSTEYPAPQSTASEAYRSGFRAEVSPKSENTEDIFLNVMYVTDADGGAPALPAYKETATGFVGITLLDRTVMFSSNGSVVNTAFDLTVRNNNNGGQMTVLLTDINAGKWHIFGEDTNLILESKASENTLTFKVDAGIYTISPADSSYSLSQQLWQDETKEAHGDFAVKYNNGYIYQPDEAKMIDNVPYISADTAKGLGFNVSVSGNTVTMSKGNNTVVTKVDANNYTLNGMTIGMTNSPKLINNTVYISPGDMRSALSIGNIEYNKYSKTLSMADGSKIDYDGYLYPQTVDGIDAAPKLCDGFTTETVTFSKEYPYHYSPITYYFGENGKHINKIQISCDYGSGNFKAYISQDGTEYSLLKDKFVQDKPGQYSLEVKDIARYIRFVPVGDVSLSEVAVYGNVPTQKTKLLMGNVTHFNLDESNNVYAYIDSGYDSASLYLGEQKIYEFQSDTNGIYKLSLSECDLVNIDFGKYDLKLSAVYNDIEYHDTVSVNIVDYKNKLTVVDEEITGNTKPYGNKNGYSFNRVIQNCTDSYENGKIKLTFANQTVSASPFVYFEGFNYGRGVYEVRFDTEFSNSNFVISNEMRGTGYSTDPVFKTVSGLCGRYQIILRLDTENNILRTYAKNIDTETDFKCIREEEFAYESLRHIRLVFSCYDQNGGYITLDNLSMDYTEISPEIILPSANETVSLEATLSAYVGKADEIIFKINGETVKTFTSADVTDDGVYSCDITFNTYGNKYFEIFVKDGDNFYVNTCDFFVSNLSFDIISQISYDGKETSLSSVYMVPVNTNKIELKLSDNISEFSKDLIHLENKGTKVDVDITYNSSSKTVTISELKASAMDDIDIVISKDTQFSVNGGTAEKIGIDTFVKLYVANINGIYSSPLVVDIANSGKVAFVYTRCLNTIETKECSLIFVQYDKSGEKLLDDVTIKKLSIEKNKLKIILQKFECEQPITHSKIMFWDNKLVPLTESYPIK